MESTLDKVSCSSESGKERLPSDTDSHHSVAIDDGNDGPQDAKDGDRKVTIADFVRFATVTDSMMNCIGILAACAAGASQPLMTIIFGNLTNSFLKFTNAVRSQADPVTIAIAHKVLHDETRDDLLDLVYLGIATLFATYIYMSAWIHTGDAITRRIRESYLSSILRQNASFFDTVGAGEVTNRLEADMHLIQEGISDKIPISVMLISTFVSGLIVAFIRSWKLTLALVSVIPCIILTGAVMNSIISKLQTAELECVSQAANVAHESLSSVRTVKSFGIENRLLAAYNAFNLQTTGLAIRRARVSGVGMGIFFFILYAAYALAFSFGGKLVADGEVHAGNIISVVFSILVGTFSLALIAPNLQALGYCTSAAGKVFATIDAMPDDDGKGISMDTCTGDVELRCVSFNYPQRPDVDILRDCTLAFPSNRVTALVGPSGSGKSTIISLLERFYEASSGQILLDHIPIKYLQKKWLRSQIGLVLQEPTLFAATVRQNIEFGLINTGFEHGAEEERWERVQQAAVLANADDFIRALPNGYDTVVGDRGLLLSGGQKQRIAIARAVIKQPRILLLDEATSALDAQSEAAVQKALEQASRGRTTIAIAHRLSTIKGADNIIVLGKEGAVLEQGKHDELVASDGVYASLVQTQNVSSGTRRERFSERNRISIPEHRYSNLSKIIWEEAEQSPTELPQRRSVGDAACLSPPIVYSQRRSMGDAACFSPLRTSIDSVAIGLHAQPAGLPRESNRDTIVHAAIDSKETEDASSSFSLCYILYRLARVNRSCFWSLYLPGLLGAAAFGCVYPCFAILLGRTLENFSQCNQIIGTPCPEPANAAMRASGNRNALWFFVVSILAGIAMCVQACCLIWNSAVLIEKLRSMSLNKMLRAPTSYFDEESHAAGALSSSIASNASRINGLLGVTMGSIVQAISTLICGAIVSLCFGWKLALVVIACIPVTLSAGFVRLQLIIRKDARLKKAHATAAQRACEAVVGIRTVASLTMEDACLDKYRSDLQGPARTVRQTAVYGNILYAFSQSASIWVTALAFWYGSRLLADGTYSPQQFYTIFLSVVFGSLQAGNAFNYAPDVSSARQAGNEILNLFDSIPDEDALADDKGIKVKVHSTSSASSQMTRVEEQAEHRKPARVTFEGVHFHYPSRPSVKVLQGLSLDVLPGTTCALAGSSGCGKSTCLQLLERFYDPTQGRTLIDGQDVREMDLRTLRSEIALVSQEPALFDGTIAFNILCGLNDWSGQDTEADGTAIAAVKRAAEQANILSFIESLPDGFQTHVGRAGTQLSGGQRQRLALARALIRNPRILLLDEATAALDAESEAVVQAALDKAAQGRTTISIAHRLASIVTADKIAYVDRGTIIESGTHAELVEARGAYAAMVSIQGLDSGNVDVQ